MQDKLHIFKLKSSVIITIFFPEFVRQVENGGHIWFVQLGSIANFKKNHLSKLSAKFGAFIINFITNIIIILIIATNLLH